ncbi:hypothetical protein IP92_02944 [Pseudoduganella flava]|uniref:Uncharacterized protein n=1 Tax=Pseudoduganella flava TaxID=871742 RepID=A0A562PQ51_9BURK|nr:hypothetical protein [Pseudoduganella flava]QGZ37774.1 hypothetical protein GO485_01015 [Pseudoduganella flava]TWI46585.1 hypothetical protein IP92_02944 [Pseudoduganella flava]
MNNDILYLLAGAAAVLMLSKKASGTGTSSQPWIPPQAIPVAVPNGWQYFTDGTAISPDGTYYYKGEPVWSPSM